MHTETYINTHTYARTQYIYIYIYHHNTAWANLVCNGNLERLARPRQRILLNLPKLLLKMGFLFIYDTKG